MTGNLPWSEGGMELLQIIMQIIDKNGGYKNMADLIITECPEFFRNEVFEDSRIRLRNKGIATFSIDKSKIIKSTPRSKNFCPWSETEDIFIQKESGKLTVSEMGSLIKRTDKAIQRRLWILRTNRKSA